MTTPEEIAARREATEQPKPETTGVFDTFVHPCLMCGTTVHVVDGQAQPHECADLPAGDNLAYAWWQGYDTAKASAPRSKGATMSEPRLYLEPDAYGEPTIWHDVDGTPQPVLVKSALTVGQRWLWDVVVARLTGGAK